jgi:hypothetical protein
MVHTNHGSLLMAVLHGGSPPPYPFVTGDLYFLKKNWSTSVVHGPDQFEDALKRPITTSTLHHNHTS